MKELLYNKLENIYNHYGLKHQLGKLQEELRELDEAIDDLLTNKVDNLEHFIEEVGDVENVIYQLKTGLDIKKDVLKGRIYKADRQIGRIASENK